MPHANGASFVKSSRQTDSNRPQRANICSPDISAGWSKVFQCCMVAQRRTIHHRELLDGTRLRYTSAGFGRVVILLQYCRPDHGQLLAVKPQSDCAFPQVDSSAVRAARVRDGSRIGARSEPRYGASAGLAGAASRCGTRIAGAPSTLPSSLALDAFVLDALPTKEARGAAIPRVVARGMSAVAGAGESEAPCVPRKIPVALVRLPVGGSDSRKPITEPKSFRRMADPCGLARCLHRVADLFSEAFLLGSFGIDSELNADFSGPRSRVFNRSLHDVPMRCGAHRAASWAFSCSFSYKNLCSANCPVCWTAGCSTCGGETSPVSLEGSVVAMDPADGSSPSPIVDWEFRETFSSQHSVASDLVRSRPRQSCCAPVMLSAGGVACSFSAAVADATEGPSSRLKVCALACTVACAIASMVACETVCSLFWTAGGKGSGKDRFRFRNWGGRGTRCERSRAWTADSASPMSCSDDEAARPSCTHALFASSPVVSCARRQSRIHPIRRASASACTHSSITSRNSLRNMETRPSRESTRDSSPILDVLSRYSSGGVVSLVKILLSIFSCDPTLKRWRRITRSFCYARAISVRS